MNVDTVEISKNEYKKILELTYKAAMLKEALLNGATLAIYGKGLYFGGGDEVATIIKYAFPEDYERKLRRLIDKKNAEEAEQTESTTIVKEGVE
nr:MAG TPA: hypothetical protein [Herelleviridae sp.]